MAVVLRIELPISADRCGRVCRANRQLLEDLLLQRAIGIDGKEIAILAVGVGDAIFVNRGCVDTPLEAVRMITYARNTAVRIARATQGVRVLKHPFNGQAGTKRIHEVSFWISR